MRFKLRITFFILRRLAKFTDESIPEISSILYAITGAIYGNMIKELTIHTAEFTLKMRDRLIAQESDLASLKIH